MIKNKTVNDTNALVMVADEMVISENLIPKPLIISQIGQQEQIDFTPYAFNSNKSLKASISHNFI